MSRSVKRERADGAAGSAGLSPLVGCSADLCRKGARVDAVAKARAAMHRQEHALATYDSLTEHVNNLRSGIAATDATVAMIREHQVRMVRLNVGGECFDVPDKNLLSEKGSFFEQLLSGNFTPEIDENGRIFIDRDPTIFRIILNFLRGYRSAAIRSEDILMILHDAHFYGLHRLVTSFDANKPITAQHMLTMIGPGMNPERDRFRALYCVAFIGERFLLNGRHSVTFEIKRAEYVGLGVVSEECHQNDTEFHRVRNCCVYYMTGVAYSNFPQHKKEEHNEKFAVGDRVTVVIDMNHRVIEYHLKGSAKCYSCASAVRLRFAVVLKLDSAVSIVGATSQTDAMDLVESSEGDGSAGRSRPARLLVQQTGWAPNAALTFSN